MANDWLLGELSWWRLLKSIIFIYGAVAIYLYFRADSMIFQPQAPSYEMTTDFIKIPVRDQDSIVALYLTNPQAKWTILYSHGNAEDLGDIRPLMEQLRAWEFNVFAYDYRGYGQSSGEASETNAYSDAAAAYQYLTHNLHVPGHRTLLYGRSLGGGVATELARHTEIAGLILESTFTSVFRVVLPMPLFPFDKFNNQAKLAQIKVPVLIIHGDVDEVIPLSHGQSLFQSAQAPKFYYWVEGANHNNLAWVAEDRLKQKLQEFTNSLP